MAPIKISFSSCSLYIPNCILNCRIDFPVIEDEKRPLQQPQRNLTLVVSITREENRRMLAMARTNCIREMFFEKGMNYASIARITGHDVKTLRKYVLWKDFNLQASEKTRL